MIFIREFIIKIKMVNKKNKKIKRIKEFKEGTYALLSEEWKQKEKNLERMTTVEGDPHYEPVTEYNIETYHSMLNAGGNMINNGGSGLIKRKYILRNKIAGFYGLDNKTYSVLERRIKSL